MAVLNNALFRLWGGFRGRCIAGLSSLLVVGLAPYALGVERSLEWKIGVPENVLINHAGAIASHCHALGGGLSTESGVTSCILPTDAMQSMGELIDKLNEHDMASGGEGYGALPGNEMNAGGASQGAPPTNPNSGAHQGGNHQGGNQQGGSQQGGNQQGGNQQGGNQQGGNQQGGNQQGGSQQGDNQQGQSIGLPDGLIQSCSGALKKADGYCRSPMKQVFGVDLQPETINALIMGIGGAGAGASLLEIL